MRGSVTLNAPSYLPALFGSRAQGNSLLASLSGRSGGASMPADPDAASGLAPAGAGRPLAPAEVEARVERDVAQFRRALAAANTPAQLLANPVALTVLLTSHGLADQAANIALATRALLSNPARSNSLLNQLKDPRWLAVNHVYSFAVQGLTILKEPETVAAICRSYAEALRAARVGQSAPAPAVVRSVAQSVEATETNLFNG